MNINKMLDVEYRRKLIDELDDFVLNEYLKNLQRLSTRKDVYKPIYEDDLKYLKEKNRLVVTAKEHAKTFRLWFGNIIGENDAIFDKKKQDLIFDKVSSSVNRTTHQEESEMQNTEVYLSRIHELSKPIDDPELYKKYLKQYKTIKQGQLNDIKTSLTKLAKYSDFEKEHERKYSQTIGNYFDILLDCDNLFRKFDSEFQRDLYFDDISKIILSNKTFLKFAFNYLKKVLPVKKNKVCAQFLKDYTDLRKTKENIEHDVYKEKKHVLENIVHETYGNKSLGLLHTSKIIGRIVVSHK